MGKSGCKYIDKDKSFIVGTEESEVIDKTGAGDVVTGVFMAMLSKTNNEKEALEMAVKVATKSVGGYGVDFLLERKK